MYIPKVYTGVFPGMEDSQLVLNIDPAQIDDCGSEQDYTIF